MWFLSVSLSLSFTRLVYGSSFSTSYASEYLTPLTAWPNWCNMVCLLLLLLCFLVSAAGPPPLWFASSRRSAVPFPSLSLSLSRELALYLHMCSIAQYVSTMGTVSVNI